MILSEEWHGKSRKVNFFTKPDDNLDGLRIDIAHQRNLMVALID
jgi:hypothetical protein